MAEEEGVDADPGARPGETEADWPGLTTFLTDLEARTEWLSNGGRVAHRGPGGWLLLSVVILGLVVGPVIGYLAGAEKSLTQEIYVLVPGLVSLIVIVYLVPPYWRWRTRLFEGDSMEGQGDSVPSWVDTLSSKESPEQTEEKEEGPNWFFQLAPYLITVLYLLYKLGIAFPQMWASPNSPRLGVHLEPVDPVSWFTVEFSITFSWTMMAFAASTFLFYYIWTWHRLQTAVESSRIPTPPTDSGSWPLDSEAWRTWSDHRHAYGKGLRAVSKYWFAGWFVSLMAVVIALAIRVGLTLMNVPGQMLSGIYMMLAEVLLLILMGWAAWYGPFSQLRKREDQLELQLDRLERLWLQQPEDVQRTASDGGDTSLSQVVADARLPKWRPWEGSPTGVLLSLLAYLSQVVANSVV